MAPRKKESNPKKPTYNFQKKKEKKDKKDKKPFDPIEEWKSLNKFKTTPRTVSVPESELNVEQVSILNLIKNQCSLSNSEFFQNPLRLIISGAAGTGKSVLLQHILIYLEEQSKLRSNFDYWAVAPTAVAAATIQGHTIHSQFGLTKYLGNLYEVLKKMKPGEVSPNDVHFLFCG